jgi:LuxR family maltose regulon positive regulatory protein
MQELLISKYATPQLPTNHITRQRLYTLVEQGIKRKLTLISAPAGFGKTTLLSHWVRMSDNPSCWVTLDAQDNDVGWFISYLISSLGSINIVVDLPIDPLKIHSLADFKEILTAFVNQIAASGVFFFMVLDNYHLIENQGIHTAVTFLLEYLPANMRMVIISRADPPLKLAQLRAKGELSEIRASDLRFTNDEAVEFLNKIGVRLRQSEITVLTQKTEGWVVGLQLASLSLSKHPDPAAFVKAFAGNDRFIADFLFDEVLHLQPSHVQLFLLHTSILHQLNASLCDAVTLRKDSHNILAELERTNLFLVPLDSQRQWYRYHQLFADLLNVRLKHQYRDIIPHLYRRVSQWYEDTRRLSEAVKYALLGEDTERVARLLEGHILEITSSSELSVLNAQMAALPADILNNNPWLALARAWGLAYNGKINLVPPLLEKAEQSLENVAKKDVSRIRGRILVLGQFVASSQGDRERALQLAEQALDTLPQRDLSMRSYAALLIGNNQRFWGNLQDAVLSHQLALRHSRLANDALLSAIILSRMADVQNIMGQLKLAFRTTKQAYDIVENYQHHSGSESYILGYVKLRQSHIEYVQNNLDVAQQLTEESLELVKQWGSIDNISLGYFNLTSIATAKGNYIQALSYIQEYMTMYPDASQPYYQIALTLEAKVYFYSGQLPAAAAWCETQRLDVRDNIKFQEYIIYLLFAQILMAQNRLSDAQIVINKILSMAQHTGAVLYEIYALLCITMVNQKLRNVDTAKTYLDRALALAAPEGFTRAFLDFGEPMAKLIYQSALNGPFKAFCSQLLTQFPTGHQVERTASGELLEPLSSRELEVLSLISEGSTNQEIAQKLHLSLYTVKSHARNIYSKLGVTNRTEAAAKARLLGII